MSSISWQLHNKWVLILTSVLLGAFISFLILAGEGGTVLWLSKLEFGKNTCIILRLTWPIVYSWRRMHRWGWDCVSWTEHLDGDNWKLPPAGRDWLQWASWSKQCDRKRANYRVTCTHVCRYNKQSWAKQNQLTSVSTQPWTLLS